MAVTLETKKIPSDKWWRKFCQRNTQFHMNTVRRGLERGKVYPVPVVSALTFLLLNLPFPFYTFLFGPILDDRVNEKVLKS